MLNCQEVTSLCSEEMDRALEIGEQMSVGLHVMMCRGCRNFRQQMKTLRNLSAAYSDGRAATPGAVPDSKD